MWRVTVQYDEKGHLVLLPVAVVGGLREHQVKKGRVNKAHVHTYR